MRAMAFCGVAASGGRRLLLRKQIRGVLCALKLRHLRCGHENSNRWYKRVARVVHFLQYSAVLNAMSRASE